MSISEETKRRWWRNRLPLIWISVGCAALGMLGVARGKGIAAVVGGALALLWVLGYFAFEAIRTPPDGASWAGTASFRLQALRKAGLAGEVQVGSEGALRTASFGVQGLFGRLEVRTEGLVWTIGRSGRLLGVRGHVRVPWSVIDSVEVGPMPGTIPRLGGGIAILLRGGAHLDGEFFGSHRALDDAIKEARGSD